MWILTRSTSVAMGTYRSVVPRYVAAILIPSIGLEWLNVRFYTFWNTTKMGVVERYEDPGAANCCLLSRVSGCARQGTGRGLCV